MAILEVVMIWFVISVVVGVLLGFAIHRMNNQDVALWHMTGGNAVPGG